MNPITQPQPFVDVSTAIGEIMQILERPYQHRADVIGLSHGIPGTSSMEDHITPPGWQPGNQPMPSNEARNAFNAARNNARMQHQGHIAQDQVYPTHELAARQQHRVFNWETQLRLDTIILSERAFIHWNWGALRARVMNEGFITINENGGLVENVAQIATDSERFLALYHALVPAWSRFTPPAGPASARRYPLAAPFQPQQNNGSVGSGPVDPHLTNGASVGNGPVVPYLANGARTPSPYVAAQTTNNTANGTVGQMPNQQLGAAGYGANGSVRHSASPFPDPYPTAGDDNATSSSVAAMSDRGSVTRTGTVRRKASTRPKNNKVCSDRRKIWGTRVADKDGRHPLAQASPSARRKMSKTHTPKLWKA